MLENRENTQYINFKSLKKSFYKKEKYTFLYDHTTKLHTHTRHTFS